MNILSIGFGALRRLGLCAGVLCVASLSLVTRSEAQTPLADVPIFATLDVPGNLVLALSVEFPTAVTQANPGAYSNARQYLGYFDPLKCYTYRVNVKVGTIDVGSYFEPTKTVASPSVSCGGQWSGNFMNWATMQAIEPFRSALTGGYRNVDMAAMTILEKAWAPKDQGTGGSVANPGNFPNKSITSTDSPVTVSSVTPFTGTNFYMHVVQCGNLLVFSRDSAAALDGDNCPSSPTPTPWNGSSSTSSGVFSVQVRVQVCVPNTANPDVQPEANCVRYGANYKPEGLIQKYASKIRYSAFGYLNDPKDDGSKLRDGGVLRARMKFVGPTQPVPGSTPITNLRAEWSTTDGTFAKNPDSDDAAASSETNAVVGNSGVINYLNQFGQSAKYFKRFDPVSELYYAATRYLRNLGDVPEYSDLSTFNGGTSTVANRKDMKDGFPVIRNWTDPILYSCQKNFVLGIGDTNTHADKNLPGNTDYRSTEKDMPSAVENDRDVDVIAATNKVGVLEGLGANIGNANNYNAYDNSAYMAGLAYKFNTTDVRSDWEGKQSISTYWLDVLENGDYKPRRAVRNQFYLTAKYGGFTVPKDYSYETNTTPLSRDLWSTNGETIPIPTSGGPRPDNFFVADQADKMFNGLATAFSRISIASGATTTSFSLPLPQTTALNGASYSSSFDPANWTGELTASSIAFTAANGSALATPRLSSPWWTFSSKLATQASAVDVDGVKGWNNNRRIVTSSSSNSANPGITFRASSLSSSDLALLDPSYVTGNDSADYINYLRGDRSNEAGVAGGTGAYRVRTSLVADIAGSKARAVGPPSFPFSESTNPGYAEFRSQKATRRTVVYFGSNDGMLHAVNGALVTTQPSPAPSPPLEQDAQAGTEMFAYVPRALMAGPSAPNTDGLASLGKPAFVHHNMVNATPVVFDVDFSRTRGGPTGNAWRSVLIGGLGKGGRSYYAIDVTDPQAMVSGGESTVASKVLWEFTHASLGFTFGEPLVVKTKKYGWVVIFVSGYNNADGKGYFFIVNPRTGALLEPPISTAIGSTTNDAGLANVNAFVVDATDGTADAAYAGDMLGNLWRLDLTGTTGNYPSPLLMAQFRSPSGSDSQPVTARPVIEVHPTTRKRFVMVGTGRLLDVSDLLSTRPQSFYAIADGTNAAFNTTLSAPLSYPITRAMLLQSTDANALLGDGAATFDPTTQTGWYIDLGIAAGSSVAYRVTTDATTLSGAVAFAATAPSTDACLPSGASLIYARNYASTASTLISDVNNPASLIGSFSIGGNATDLRYLSVNGTARLVAGTDNGTLANPPITPAVPLRLRRLNWRELPTID